MPSIQFSGLASGIDTQALIEAILEQKRRPIERLEARRTLYNEQKAAFEELRAKLSNVETALRDISSESTFRGRTVTISDTSILKATAGTNAEKGLFEITVSDLAAAHKVRSSAFTSADVGLVQDGTISIQSGSNDLITIDVSADDGNNTLQSIRDAINAADAGVEAAVLFDGSQYLLTVRATETGTANALSITDSTDLNLDTNEVVSEARDAQITVDGVAITSASNRISSIIPGVTLDLLDTTGDDEEGHDPITVEVAQDFDTIVDSTQKLVEEYNALADFFRSQDNRDNPGPLGGNQVLIRTQLQLQGLFTGGVDGIPLGQVRSLSGIGVDFEDNGRATLDQARLRELLDTNFDDVGNLFLASGVATSSRVQYLGSSSATVNGEYAVTVSQAAEQASVTNGQFLPFGLLANETLTIESGSDSVDVDLTSGDTTDDVIAKINAALEGSEIGAVAFNDDNTIRITTTAFGSGANITVRSDLNGSGTGFTTAGVTDNGEDVEGEIGGVAAIGSGQTLTGAVDGDYDGLLIKVTATPSEIAAQSGDFGTISYSRGLIRDIEERISTLTGFGSGVLELATDALDANIERIDDDIVRIEDRISVVELRLLRTFGAAEQAISTLQSQQAALGGFFPGA